MHRYLGGVIIFNEILNAIEHGVLLLNQGLDILFINSTAASFMGVGKDNYSGKNIWDLDVPPEILIPITSKHTGTEYYINSQEHEIVLTGFPLNGTDNSFLTLWVMRKEKRNNTDEIDNCRTTEQELNAIIESVSDGIYVTDGDGYTLRVNSAFQQITGIKADDVEGRHVEELIRTDVFRKSATISVLAERKQVSMVEQLKIGKEVLLTGTPVYDDNGNIFRVVTTLRDMESLNELKEQLAVSQEKTKLYERELFQLRLQQMDMDDVVIYSQEMRDIVETAIRVAEVNSNVLLSGESGVGKDIIAKIIHKSGLGEDAPLITCNCGAIPESLIESELFGYEGGAFTGAKKEGNPGMFELARGGTLFLDEVGELPLSFQAKFLRAIQEKEITRVGGNKPIKLDFRLIAATNRNLEDMVIKKQFRSDLYYRLNVVPLYIPPLRERKESIVSFVYKFLEIYNKQFNRSVQISSGAMQILENYNWPGNVRELKNIIERMVVLVNGTVIEESDIPVHISGMNWNEADNQVFVKSVMPLKKAIEELEFQLLSKTYTKYKSTRKAAQILGISQSQTSRKLSKYNIYTGPENL